MKRRPSKAQRDRIGLWLALAAAAIPALIGWGTLVDARIGVGSGSVIGYPRAVIHVAGQMGYKGVPLVTRNQELEIRSSPEGAVIRRFDLFLPGVVEDFQRRLRGEGIAGQGTRESTSMTEAVAETWDVNAPLRVRYAGLGRQVVVKIENR
jgi:hypothetical protein